MRISRLLPVAVFASSLLASAADSGSLQFKPHRVIKRALPAITNAPIKSVHDDLSRLVRDSELVLGVVANGKARAYPINMLTGPHREIINDVLGGQPIAATW